MSNHAHLTLYVHLLPVISEQGGRHISDRTEVEAFFSDCSTDTIKVSLFAQEHGDETRLAHPSRSMYQKQVVFVGNIAIIEGCLQVHSWI